MRILYPMSSSSFVGGQAEFDGSYFGIVVLIEPFGWIFFRYGYAFVLYILLRK